MKIQSNKINKVYVQLPKTGLGNKLLVWAKGMVFAKLNNLPLIISSWWGFQWGAIIRRENKSRLYMGYFKESALPKRYFIKANLLFYKIIREPKVEVIREKENKNTIYHFNKVITNEDLYGELRSHRELISKELFSMLTPNMRNQLDKYINPEIGIHVRRGDFKIGNQTTPLAFFVQAINLIRQTRKETLPVTIFTDASPGEISELLALPNVMISETKPDILDILLLSKSKIMILSKSSTFGYWAAFLSDALVIRPHYDWQEKIRDNEGNYLEVKWDPEDLPITNDLENIILAVP